MAKIMLELEYKDFYGLIEAVDIANQTGHCEYFYLKDLLMKKVFELAAGTPTNAEWHDAGWWMQNTDVKNGGAVRVEMRIRQSGQEPKKIQQIKVIRSMTDLALRDAKDVVDNASSHMGNWYVAPGSYHLPMASFFDSETDYGYEFQFKHSGGVGGGW